MANSAILVRVPPQLKKALEKSARENFRSVNQEVRAVLARQFAPAPQPEKE